METSDPSAAADDYPRWVMLQRYCCHGEGEHEGSCTVDAKTVAASLTSTGQPVRVSLRLAAPPTASHLCFHSPDGVEAFSYVVAAHGDSVLIKMCITHPVTYETVDYFVYSAGAGPARPPSLSLLPPCYLNQPELEESGWQRQRRRQHQMCELSTALLSRVDDELMVAELWLNIEDREQVEAQLCVLRSGKWEVKRLPIRHDEGKQEELYCLDTSEVVPVGDRSLCWADCYRGIIFSDVSEEIPELRYVSLPAEHLLRMRSKEIRRRTSGTLCGTGGGAVVKFVSVFPRCCCGEPGGTFCPRSRNAFTINTWTLRMDDMTWEKDGVMDAGELWSLDGYQGLPCVKPSCSVVSMDEPHVIFFVVCEFYIEGDYPVWLIEVDTRSKELRSVSRCSNKETNTLHLGTLPSEVSRYFRTTPQGSNNGRSASKSCKGAERPAVRTNPSRDPSQPSSYKSSAHEPLEAPKVASPEEIMAALQEIPDLARDDTLRAYSILTRGNGCLFRSLLGLPMDMRKDWLLMEIKNCDACSICSACMDK